MRTTTPPVLNYISPGDSVLTTLSKRWAYAAWLLVIAAFAVLHVLHLSADFPNHSPWFNDWAKYTDEGWYGNAAVRAHLLGHWYMAGDFNPAPAVPVWPFLEWILFFFTGVSMVAARALAVGFFGLDLLLGYLLLRASGSRWMALLAVTLALTSPFLYAFSRLAILEPMLMAFLLAALNLAVRLPRMRRPVAASVLIGVLFTLMLLTKTSAVFLLPALGWAMMAALYRQKKLAVACTFAAASAAVTTFGLWMAIIIHFGLLQDYQYLFFINNYIKPANFYWPLLSFWWALHGGLWAGRLLIPLAGIAVLAALLGWRTAWGRALCINPAFGASVLAVAGYILFMTYQNHPQPRYFTVIALFSFFVLAMGIEALHGAEKIPHYGGVLLLAATVIAAGGSAASTLSYAAHPEYTFVSAARQLTAYIDAHPNGRRMLVSISGDDISMITHLPSLCDDFGTQDLPGKLAAYQPGWWATWNDIDPGTLEDLHIHYSLEQVARFRAFDDPDRNILVLFKLHPLPDQDPRDPREQNLQVPLPGDIIDIPIE